MEQLERQTAHFRTQPQSPSYPEMETAVGANLDYIIPHGNRWWVGAYVVVGRAESGGLETGRKRVARRAVAGKPANIATFHRIAP